MVDGKGRDIKLAAVRESYEKRSRDRAPKFRKLFDAFVETLERGFWRPGDHVPTEKEFSAALGISGGTVQSFMRELMNAGIVSRRRGVGSHITEFDEKTGENWYLRFSTEMNGAILPIKPVHITISESPEQGPWCDFLGSSPSFIRIFRIMRIGDSHLVPTEFYLDAEQFHPLLDFNPETIGTVHIRTILADRFQMPVANVEEALLFPSPIDLPADVRDGISECRAILEVLNFSFRNQPLFYQRIFLPPSLCRLKIGYTSLPIG